MNLKENIKKSKEIKGIDVHSIENNVQRALDAAGFGTLNYKVIIAAGITFLNAALIVTSVGFILPYAACDFRMDTVDKGRLSTATIVGMLLGVNAWGFIADIIGRRDSLLAALLIQTVCEISASLIPHYWGVVASKGISGFSLSGQIAILFTYVAEFQPTKQRGRALSFISIFGTVGAIMSTDCVLGLILGSHQQLHSEIRTLYYLYTIISVLSIESQNSTISYCLDFVAWLIIPLNVNIESGKFHFHSWNLYVLICAIPSLLIAIWLLTLPETPKFLAESGQEHKLGLALFRLHKENTRDTSEKYMENLRNVGINSIKEIIFDKHDKNIEKIVRKTWMQTIVEQARFMIKPHYLGKIIIVCLMSFCTCAALYSLMLWYPELFKRYKDYEENNMNMTESGVCVVSLRVGNASLNETFDVKNCDASVDMSVFFNSLISRLPCIPLGVFFFLYYQKLGFKIFLPACFAISAAATIGLMFIVSSIENVILCCLFDSFTSLASVIIPCAVVEIFPTNLRMVAAALSLLSGRLGGIMGNTTFSYLIDYHCTEFLYLVIGELTVGGILTILLSADTPEKIS